MYEEHNEIEEGNTVSHSQQMVEALDRQELEEAEVQFQQALLEDSEAQLLDLGQYLESIGFTLRQRNLWTDCRKLSRSVSEFGTILAEEGQMEEAFAYFRRNGPESNWYVASLLVKGGSLSDGRPRRCGVKN